MSGRGPRRHVLRMLHDQDLRLPCPDVQRSVHHPRRHSRSRDDHTRHQTNSPRDDHPRRCSRLRDGGSARDQRETGLHHHIRHRCRPGRARRRHRRTGDRTQYGHGCHRAAACFDRHGDRRIDELPRRRGGSRDRGPPPTVHDQVRQHRDTGPVDGRTVQTVTRPRPRFSDPCDDRRAARPSPRILREGGVR